MRLPSLRLLVLVWTSWSGICFGATLAAWDAGEPVGAIISGLCFVFAVAVAVYCYRGLDRPQAGS